MPYLHIDSDENGRSHIQLSGSKTEISEMLSNVIFLMFKDLPQNQRETNIRIFTENTISLCDYLDNAKN